MRATARIAGNPAQTYMIGPSSASSPWVSSGFKLSMAAALLQLAVPLSGPVTGRYMLIIIIIPCKPYLSAESRTIILSIFGVR
jgi:hypothetical protein